MNFTEATVTEVINDVTIAPQGSANKRPAQKNDRFLAPEVIRTGPESRAELTAPDQTLTRVGANTIFSFDPNGRTINLNSGSILFNSPKGKGGGEIRTASATAAVLGTTIIVSATSNGGFKFMVLEGKGEVKLPNGLRQVLSAGQLTFIAPGSTQFSQVIPFDLKRQTEGSKLVKGFSKELQSMTKVQEQVDKQQDLLKKGRALQTEVEIGDAKKSDSFEQKVNPDVRKPVFERVPLETFVDRDIPVFDPSKVRLFDRAGNIPYFRVDASESIFNQKVGLYLGRNVTISSHSLDLSSQNYLQGFGFYADRNLEIKGGGTLAITGFNNKLGLFGRRNIYVSDTDITFSGKDLLFQTRFGDINMNFNAINNRNLTASGSNSEIVIKALGGDVDIRKTVITSTKFTGSAAGLFKMDTGNVNVSTLSLEANTIVFRDVTFANNSTGNFRSRDGTYFGSSNSGATIKIGSSNFLNCQYGLQSHKVGTLANADYVGTAGTINNTNNNFTSSK